MYWNTSENTVRLIGNIEYLHAYLKWEIMGISDMHVIPMIITCMLQGTLCDTGIPCTFYGGNICSVPMYHIVKTFFIDAKNCSNSTYYQKEWIK